jgi:uncharacterized repeat protein (TIGR01451 family)
MANVVREAVEGIGISKLPETLGNPAFFTEVAIPEIVTIPAAKPDMEQLLSVMVDAKIVSLRIVDTPKGTSYEGQKLTGKKLSIELLLKQKVKYIADEPTQSVHAAHFEHTVNSIWVIVPEKINCKSIETLLMQGKLVVTPYIEDIYGEQLDKRTIFKNITVLIHVTTPCLLPTQANLKLLKKANKNHVKVGDTITYSVVVKNAGTVKATNVIFKDTLPDGTSYVADTFKVDGTAVAGDPTTGVNIGDIDPGASKIVTFDVLVDEIPYPCAQLTNASQAQYDYINIDGQKITDTAKSNTVIVDVDEVLLTVIKTGPDTATLNSNITYTVVIKNEGTVTLNDITFTDVFDPTAKFVDDSFRINGSIKPGEDPSSGVIIGSLDPDDSVAVSFDATVTVVGTIVNNSAATYTYSLDPCGQLESDSSNSNPVYTDVSTPQTTTPAPNPGP